MVVPMLFLPLSGYSLDEPLCRGLGVGV